MNPEPVHGSVASGITIGGSVADKQTEQTQQIVAQRLEGSRRLPTLPAVALQLIDLANDETANLDDFAKLATRDPALAGKLLRVANSSFYGRRRTVSSLSQALNLLGLNATVTLALGFSLRHSLDSQPNNDFDVAQYWRRCLLHALACRTLAIELRESQPEVFFLAALLHDIGVLVMEATLGDAYATLHAESDSHEDILLREADEFGFNHADAGYWLLNEWGLPPQLCASVVLSHDAEALKDPAESEEVLLGACVAAAADIAEVWLNGGNLDEFAAVGAEIEKKLALDSAGYQRLIAAMAEQIPDVEAMFEVSLVDQKLLVEAEYSAREILIARNLQMLQTAADSERQSRALERRTTALEEQARRDAMTGLFNRRYMEHVLEQEFLRAGRELTPLTVVLIDIDGFNQINNIYGHAAGDQVIVGVARRLLCQVRQTDIVARYGGEEFVVVLTGARSSDAQSVIERVLTAIGDAPFRIKDVEPVPVSASAGMATYVERSQPFSGAALLLQAADTALYQAKRAGRGRLIIYEPRAN